jgi:hypothetical protein
MRAYEQARPALEWFEAHCRFLTKLERVVRKLDDPNAFVCDPSAKGRPANLTSALVLEYSTLPSQMYFQTMQGSNHVCKAKDERAGRVALAFHDLTDMQIVELLCYGDERPACVEARANIAKARSEGQR